METWSRGGGGRECVHNDETAHCNVSDLRGHGLNKRKQERESEQPYAKGVWRKAERQRNPLQPCVVLEGVKGAYYGAAAKKHCLGMNE